MRFLFSGFLISFIAYLSQMQRFRHDISYMIKLVHFWNFFFFLTYFVDVLPGDAIVAADSPVGRLGLTVCYDLRFPELYQLLRFQHQAQVFVVMTHLIPTNNSFLFCAYCALSFTASRDLMSCNSSFWMVIYKGFIGTVSIHNGNRGGPLGNPSSCSCNWDTVLRTQMA